MGTSPYQVMFHHSHWYASADGGHNYARGTAPGTPGGGFAYVRQAGSRTQPSGLYFAMLDAPSDYDGSGDGARASAIEEAAGRYGAAYKNHADKKAHAAEKKRLADAGRHNGEGRDFVVDKHNNPVMAATTGGGGGNVKWIMTSTDFGANFSWAKMPANLQTGGFVVDPTSANSLYTMTANCLAHSVDNGATWSPCLKADGLTGSFHQLVVKDSSTMFMLRNGAVPLRTKDGGKSWAPLAAAAPLFKYGATFDASLSWTGKTLVLHGTDGSAISRAAYGTAVWKSSDDGDSWADETGDLVTISPGSGVWYETDFYFVTAGEGICVKRNFE